MDTIIISVIIAIAIAVAAYYLGKANGWQECSTETKSCINLPSPVDTLSRATPIPHHYLTRYVPMNMELWRQVNDEVKKLEDQGFTVDECDTDHGFITMTKAVYKNKVELQPINPKPLTMNQK